MFQFVAATITDVSCERIYGRLYDQDGKINNRYYNNYLTQRGDYICLKFADTQQSKFIQLADDRIAWCVLAEKGFNYKNYLNNVKVGDIDVYGNYYYILQRKQPKKFNVATLPDDIKIDENGNFYKTKSNQIFLARFGIQGFIRYDNEYKIYYPNSKQLKNISEFSKQQQDLIGKIVDMLNQEKDVVFEDGKFFKKVKSQFQIAVNGVKFFLKKINDELFAVNGNLKQKVQLQGRQLFVTSANHALNPKCLVIIGKGYGGGYHTQIRDTQDNFFTQKLSPDISNILKVALNNQRDIFRNVLKQNKDNMNATEIEKAVKIIDRTKVGSEQQKQDEITKYIGVQQQFNGIDFDNLKFQNFKNIKYAPYNDDYIFNTDGQNTFLFKEKQLFSLVRQSKINQQIFQFLKNKISENEFQRCIYLSIQQNYVGDDAIQFCLNQIKDNDYILTQLITRRYLFKIFPKLTKMQQLTNYIIKMIVDKAVKSQHLYYVFKLLQTTQKIGNSSVRDIVLNSIKNSSFQPSAQLIAEIFNKNDNIAIQRGAMYSGYSDKVDKFKDMIESLLESVIRDENNIKKAIEYIKVIAQSQSQLQQYSYCQSATKINSIKTTISTILFNRLKKITKLSSQKKIQENKNLFTFYEQLLKCRWFQNFCIDSSVFKILNSKRKATNKSILDEILDNNSSLINNDNLREIAQAGEYMKYFKINNKYNNPFYPLYFYSNPNVLAKKFIEICFQEYGEHLVFTSQKWNSLNKEIKEQAKVLSKTILDMQYRQFRQIIFKQYQKYFANKQDYTVVDKKLSSIDFIDDFDKMIAYFQQHKNDDDIKQQYDRWIAYYWKKFAFSKKLFLNEKFANAVNDTDIVLPKKNIKYLIPSNNKIVLDNKTYKNIKSFCLFSKLQIDIRNQFIQYFKSFRAGKNNYITVLNALVQMAAAVNSNKDDSFKEFVNQLIKDKAKKTIDKINSLNKQLPKDALYLKEYFKL